MTDLSAPEGAAGPTPSFDDLGLSPEILKAIAESGYTTPTPIQAAAIPVVLQGRDVLGIAQTGTGKTASFTLPMIEILSRGRAKARMPRTLILEPTRELAAQVAESFDKYGKYHKLTKALLIGGVSFTDQDMLLSQGVDVLIATPGRLLDHFERGKLLLSGVQVMVVDEADRMLDMGFIPDIERIFKLTPFTRQTLFFSATMPPEITRLTEAFLSSPKRIEASRPATAASTITQRIIKVPAGDPRTRRAALRAVLESCGYKNGIIFCNRKTDVDIVAKSLQRHGYSAAPLHGDLDQRFRMQTLDRFKSGDVKLLVASDVAARGLDIPDVTHVFNYEPSRHADDYVHRIGRTGRAGRTGASFTLIAPADDKYLQAIEKLIGSKIEAARLEGVPTERLGDEADHGGRGRRREERQQEDRRRQKGKRKDGHRSPPGRGEDGPSAEAQPKASTPKVERESAQSASGQQQRERQRGAERKPSPPAAPRADAVLGFGDDAPAFLNRGPRRSD